MEINRRNVEHGINELFPLRWSPRAMSGAIIEKKALMQLFEAARWAPSAFNNQPWRFVYAMSGTKYWDTLFNLLSDGNKIWCKDASALVVIASKKTFDHNEKPSKTHSFDTGAAWENIALQGTFQKLVVHAMSGFSYEKAKSELRIPDDYDVEAMIAIGFPGSIDDLPEKLQQNEHPSDRKKIGEFVYEGEWR